MPGGSATAQQQPTIVLENVKFDGAQRGASFCETGLTNVMQALRLFLTARDDLARKKATSGETARASGRTTC